MPRKIIQIANSFAPSTIGENGQWDNLYALCDDGTVWVKDWPFQTDERASKWKMIENVPQGPSGDDIAF